MSTPMYDLPDHLWIGLTSKDRGPVDPDEPEFDHWGCWCGEENCDKPTEPKPL